MFRMIKPEVVAHFIGVEETKLAKRALVNVIGMLHVVVLTETREGFQRQTSRRNKAMVPT
jgi:hypothetical protein